MSAIAFDGTPDPFRRHRRQRTPRWLGWAVLAGALLFVAALLWLRGPTITEHDREHKIINVVLPPPPPPPPPPPEQKPAEPEKPKPIDQPQPTPETPPPPTPAPPQAQQPAPTNDALTARTGAGPTNYGLAQGDGSGTRIGGRPGGLGNGQLAYAQMVLSEFRRAIQRDPKLGRGRYTVSLSAAIGADGAVRDVRLIHGSGDGDRDAALRRLLASLTLSKPPPSDLPRVNIEFTARPSL